MEVNEKILTVKQAAKKLGLNDRQVLRRIQKGDIQAEKLGWVWVIDVEEIERYKEAIGGDS